MQTEKLSINGRNNESKLKRIGLTKLLVFSTQIEKLNTEEMKINQNTAKYTLFKNKPDSQITSNEIKCFIGILILSRYNSLPSKKNYWENESDIKNEIVSNNMRPDRFFQIMRFMHCGDNTKVKVDDSDKMWKLCPLVRLWKKLNKNVSRILSHPKI